MRILSRLSLRQRLLLGAAGFVVTVLIIGGILLLVRSTNAAEEQPIEFNHQVHINNGMQCQFCHSGVTKSPAAGIPSVELCMGCHGHIATDKPEIKKLTAYWEKGEPIPWQRVNQQPSYVFFNHSAHYAAGVGCGSCHGDVSNMTVAESVVEMNMGFCLGCHADQPHGKDVLWDCTVCHR